jgi:hypothetical protein
MANPINPWKQYTRAWSKPTIEAFMHLDASDASQGGAKYDGKFMGEDLFKIATSYMKKFRKKVAIDRQGVIWILNSTEALHRYSNGLNKDAKEMTSSIARGLLEGADAFINSRTPDFNRYMKPESGFLPERMDFLVDIIFKGQFSLYNSEWTNFWETNLSKCSAPIFDKYIDCPFK